MSRVVVFDVPGEPVPWARAGSNRKTGAHFTRQAQRSYMDAVRWQATAAMRGKALLKGAIALTVTATWPWPQRTSAAKRNAPGANLKSTKPDASNVAKLIEDALNTIVYEDDARIADLHVAKRYGDDPSVRIVAFEQ